MNVLPSYITGEWVKGNGDGLVMHDAVTGDEIGLSTTEGLDIAMALEYGRKKGEALRKMTFQERGLMLKKLALYLNKRKEQFYEISYRTGATRIDSWIDIEGGFGNLFANASLRKLFPNTPYDVEGDAIDLSRGGRFMAHHILVPKEGVAIHINAFNFPVWGMLEKCAVNWMAGMSAVVLPAPQTAYLTEAVVREIIASGILPEGSLQLLSGKTTTILDSVISQDVITFTGSAHTARLLKNNKRLLEESVPFTTEADSLNASILGPDAKPGTAEFDIFIKEVRNEMTAKAGQKCTAIRRVIVPENLIDAVEKSLSSKLDDIAIGNPRNKSVRMGALASKQQVEAFKRQLADLASAADIVYGSTDPLDILDADFEKGAFVSPVLLRDNNPLKSNKPHEVEAFGPLATIMPYKTVEDAIAIAKRGKGSLVSSVVTADDAFAKAYTIGAASHHGRILTLNRESAPQSTGHGSPLPLLVHGGPGRAGGGEEMGGVRGIKHFMQRCAIQGSPTTLTEITEIYQPNAAYKPSENHPFSYHWEDIKPGMSLETHKRTLTDSDIQNFANLTWDHFYAHTDITSLEGSIFEKRTAHGYFIVAAAAGLFVYPNKGPVAANYGLENIRFLRPLYHNDTIYVRLTCKQKVDRESRGKEHPSGIVKWFVEVFDADPADDQDALVAIATILTMVQKKQTALVEMTEEKINQCLSNLKSDTAPKWGRLTPQHLMEHLEYTYKIAAGEIQDFEISTPDKILEKVNATLYNYEPFPKNVDFPLMKKDELEPLVHADLDTAKAKFKEARAAYKAFFKSNPHATLKNVVFGDLNKYEWHLLERKHLNHHFNQFGIL